MSRRFILLLLCLVSFQVLTFAQGTDRGGSAPSFTPGQGMSMGRHELEEIRNNAQDKKTSQADVFMFGVSFSLIDSVLFVSDIQKMDNETINNSWFLKNRQGYENQFSAFVSNGDDETMITYLSFAFKEKKAKKQRADLLKKNGKSNKLPVSEVGGAFKFESIK